MSRLKALRIHPLYVDLILRGRKNWEMRSTPRTWRGSVALVKIGSLEIVGVVDLVDVKGPLSEEERHASQDKHCVAPHHWLSPRMAKYKFAWVLHNPRALAEPVSFVHVNGTQSWFVLDEPTSARVRSALGC